ncbi:MAG: GIY-YIG nuclease family protein [Candidatus Parcubacteria bacterium]|nr:GIY-YIG nuclease family protein [Candidatus Parcubacteria bacterium]
MAFVYILKFATGKFYVGSTTDIQNRLEHHMGGYTPSTKRLGEGKLVLKQDYPTLQEARSVEYKLKKLKRHDYIAKIVQDGYIKIVP